MKPMAIAPAAVLLAALAAPALPGAGETPFTAAEVLRRHVEAAGGRSRLDGIKALRFRVGAQTFTAAGDRLKIESALEAPAVYEALLADERGVRRNTLGRVAPVTGIEACRWRILARLYGGAFTLDRFAGALAYGGTQSFGPERFHRLVHEDCGLRVEFHVDAADFLLKRLVLSGRDDAGQPWEQSGEFAAFAPHDGVMLPTVLFFSQLGVSGTYSQRPQPLGDVSLNPGLAEGFFSTLEINAGEVRAEPGGLAGNILGSYFSDEDLFVVIFTNWSAADVAAAGFANGDLLVLSSGDAELETRLFVTENLVDDPTVYAPGKSLFTHTPDRRPLFYAQVNTCSPPEKFQALKSGIRLLAPARLKKK